MSCENPAVQIPMIVSDIELPERGMELPQIIRIDHGGSGMFSHEGSASIVEYPHQIRSQHTDDPSKHPELVFDS